MKVIISGGGTGGHIHPAIALADAFKKHNPNAEILFVGANGRMEMSKVPEAGYKIVGLDINGLQRKSLLSNLTLPFKIIKSIRQARSIINDFKPDVVLGTGGYASAPIVYAAARCKIPTIIQEQNAAAGLTNKILGRYVNKVCVAYDDMTQYFPKEKIVFTGNPIRPDLTNLNKNIAKDYFDLDHDKKCLFVLGGSLGAQNINQTIFEHIDEFIKEDIQIIWATGKNYFENIKTQLTAEQKKLVKVYPFIEAINLAYAAADVVISRGGAVSISELCLAQKPVIFVPSPNVTNDHQTKNVMQLVMKDAAIMVKDSETSQELFQKTITLLDDDLQLKKLSDNIKQFAKPNATDAIVDEALRLIKTV